MKKISFLTLEESNRLIDYTGMVLIGIISLGYSLYSSYFAKLRIDIPLVNVPFFVGEMLFVACLFLFSIKWLINPKETGIFVYLFYFYLAFVIVKTLHGYLFFGPLSLRHCVLFLYPLFAVFTRSFYRSEFFSFRNVLSYISLFFVLFLYSRFFNTYDYAGLTWFSLTVILINVCPNRRLRRILYILLLLLFPYKIVFTTSRTFIVSNLSAIIYISLGFLAVSRFRGKVKLALLLFIISFIFYGVWKNCSLNELRSLIGIEDLIKRYDNEIKAFHLAEKKFLKRKLVVRLYNKQTSWSPEPAENEIEDLPEYYLPENTQEPDLNAKYVEKAAVAVQAPAQSSGSLSAPKLNSSFQPKTNSMPPAQTRFQPINQPREIKKNAMILTEEEKEAQVNNDFRERGPDIPYHNSLFRIFIWKDALEELSINKPLFGFAFGRPFRSRMIEVLSMAYGEWSRDGWISFHNSYLDIVYRSGVLGVLMIVFILFIVGLFIKKSFQNRSLTGILLTGILINWFIAANFLEILELPYSAIPMWSLFGLTSAYMLRKKAR